MDEVAKAIVYAFVGAVAGKFVHSAWSRRYGNGHTSHNLRAARELADLTATVEDLLRRIGDVEASVQRFWRDTSRGHRRGE